MSSEHTHREHTPGAVGSHCSSARGAVGGSVPCSRAPQSWYWRWRECCSFTLNYYYLEYWITFNLCRTWDSNPQPLDYKSDSLTIRPRLPPYFRYMLNSLHLRLILYRNNTILVNSDIKTHFKHSIKKCALCNKEILQIKFNYNFISVSLKWYVNKYG